MTEVPELRAVVTWKGPGEPVMLTLYGPGGEVALPLSPTRALTLAKELLTAGVSAIKSDPAAPWAPDQGATECRKLRVDRTWPRGGRGVRV